MCIRDSINPDPPATAQLQHAITWKPYGLVPSFGYMTCRTDYVQRALGCAFGSVSKTRTSEKRLSAVWAVLLHTAAATAFPGT